MLYADVAVNSPGYRSSFSYAVPPHIHIDVGFAVWIPFGRRIAQGIVLQITSQPSVQQVKEIIAVVDDDAVLTEKQLELGKWISQYYLSSLYAAFSLMLSPGFSRKAEVIYSTSTKKTTVGSLSSKQRELWDFIEQKKGVSTADIIKKFDQSYIDCIIPQLLRMESIVRDYKFPRTKVSPKQVTYVELKATKEQITSECSKLESRKAYQQVSILKFLLQKSKAVTTVEIRQNLNCSLSSLRALENKQLISMKTIDVPRNPLNNNEFPAKKPHILTISQQNAWQKISTDLERNTSDNAASVILLNGVTGSGKTELYLHALDKVVSSGKRGICLVPEIALTPQTVARFSSRYPGRVGIVHSNLSLGKLFEEWHRIKEGKYDVVIGPRSALFVPQPNIGLIVVDEEHGRMYKQEDRSPRYHARDVAVKMGELYNAAVILGSATPDVVSYFKARKGKYHLVTLDKRIAAATSVIDKTKEICNTEEKCSHLPEVTVVDMKEELRKGNKSLLSRLLSDEIRRTLDQGDQIILFLNRRGTSTVVQCASCGFTFRCPRCSVALTYHKSTNKLLCHHCRYSVKIPLSCPRCSHDKLLFLGIGTQKVVEQVSGVFPDAKIIRLDSDLSGKQNEQEELLANFSNYKANVLIGTQMIAKGLDLPDVTLVGVINADTSINLPDYRAGEQTFQLLCQVAGRAGRGFKAGKVVIQTFSPQNYAVRAAAHHDYAGFYGKEIQYRQRHGYPPFSRMVRLIYSHTNELICRREIQRLHQKFASAMKEKQIKSLSIIGPTPAYISRLRGKYRWQLFLRGDNPAAIIVDEKLSSGWIVDVDPVDIG